MNQWPVHASRYVYSFYFMYLILYCELGKVGKVEVFMAADTWGAAATDESKLDLLLYADALQVHVILRNGADFAAASQLDHSP